MKKIITMFAVAAVAVSATFADQVMHALDFSIPFENRSLKVSGDHDDYFDKLDVSTTGFDFNYDRMAVGDSGFSFIFGIGMGYNSVNLDLDGYDVDTNNYDLRLKLGWGGSPIHSDKMLLSIHGFTGMDFKAGVGEKSDVDFVFIDYSMPIGVDAVFAIKLTDTFGLTAGLDIFTNIFSAGLLTSEYEYKEYHSGSYYSSGYYTTEIETTSDFLSSVFNGFNITPKIGICWILGD